VDWKPIYATLEKVAMLSGIVDPHAIVWGQQSGAGAWIIGPGTGAKLVMTIRGTSSQGLDYEETTPAPVAGQDQIKTLVGCRQFIWTIAADAFSGDPARFALGFLDSLRARLNRMTTQEMFRVAGVAGLAVVEIMATQEVSYIEKGSDRQVVRYTMDVQMATAENDVDATTTAGDYFNKVGVRSQTLKNPDGTDVVPQINETIG
jgi:hypothetical protein